MKKTVVWSLITAAGVALAVWAASIFVPFSYGEWSFFIGLGLTIFLFFFSGSGGFFSRIATFNASASIGKVQDDNQFSAYLGGIFYGLLLYTVISLVLMLFLYF
ncbi:hypothetical protein [Jeotgalibacillus campisalis]|uniref:hypothetical protein n=1 Tax=Jeotgalibacillus campisalis TaxID=220754 RepID=UPI0012EB4826|nr:hypothetical protein [Jeotgalibacillus campisalis]